MDPWPSGRTFGHRTLSLLALLARYAPLGPVRGCEPLVAHQAADVFALWQAWEGDGRLQAPGSRRQPPPFWATVWPAARVLARWLLDHPVSVAGARVLDLGCGGAVVAIAAATAGAARVVANDADPAALIVARANAAANGVSIACSGDDLLADPSTVPTDTDVALVADLFYEKEQAARTLRLLVQLRAQGARVIVADAGRPFAPTSGFAVLARERVDVDRDLEGVGEREVSVLEMT